MGGVLVNDEKTIIKFYQPIGFKQLADQPVTTSGFRYQQLFLKQLQLFRSLLLLL